MAKINPERWFGNPRLRKPAAVDERKCEVLFVCAPSTGHKGLGWNAWHSVAALRASGISADWIQCAALEIYGKIAEHNPRVAVIMAFWVPTDVLGRLADAYPGTVFVVKNHSGHQFLAQETRGWPMLLEVAGLSVSRENVRLAAIKADCTAALCALGARAVELPNVYDPSELSAVPTPRKLPGFHVGLFGAYRPLKNAVGMALAVALAAKRSRQKMTLHVNGSRGEMGSPNDGRIIEDICNRSGVKFVQHGWLDHLPFKELAGQMHVAIAATFSDTYNYVAADCVTAGTTVIGSDALYWLPDAWRVNPDSTADLTNAIIEASSEGEQGEQLISLRAYNELAMHQLIGSLRELGLSEGA